MLPHSRTLRCAPALLFLLLAATGAEGQEAEVLTLDDVVHRALAESHEVRQAEALRLAGRAERTEGFGQMLPSVSFRSGFTRSDILQRTASDPVTGGIVQLPDSLVQDRRSFGTRNVVSLNWTLFSGGRNLTLAAAGRSRGRSADLGVRATRVQVAADATLAYLDVLEADAVVAVRRAEEDHARELERTAEARFETGEVPEIDFLQARLALSEAQVARLDAEAEARILRAVLVDRIGLPAGRSYTLAPPPPAPEVDADAIREEVVEGSPVIAALRARRDAASREVRAGRLQLLPTVGLGVDRVWSEWGQNRDAFTLDPRNSEMYYRISLSWTPFERPGADIAARQRNAAALLEAEAEMRGARRAVEAEVARGAERWTRAALLGERARINLQLAERQRDQADERYRLGLAPLTERLQAMALWAEAARQEAIARYAPLRALAEMERATGVALRAPVP